MYVLRVAGTSKIRHVNRAKTVETTRKHVSFRRRAKPMLRDPATIIRRMSTKPGAKRAEYDIIEPIGKRVVVRKDDNKRETRGGIVLPDSHEIPVITGRVIAVSKAIENDGDQTIRQYDKVLFDPREAIPVELEHDNRLFVVHIDRAGNLPADRNDGRSSEEIQERRG